MDFTTTKGAGLSSINAFVYGPTGAGKTRLLGTTGDDAHTLIIAIEDGLLTLADRDIRVKAVKSIDELADVYRFLRRGDHDFRWVCIDSVSELAERFLAAEKYAIAHPDPGDKPRDPRQAYGEMIDRISGAMKAFCALPLHVVVIAKQEQVQDDTGRILYGPSAPGKKLGAALPYDFDIVMAMRVEPGPNGTERWLQTQPDGCYVAKDRSNRLAPREAPDLASIAQRIGAVPPAAAEAAPETPE